MKLLFYILFFQSFLLFSQTEKKYILLDSLQSKYKVEKYTLNTKSLYKVDTEVEVYNVMKGDVILLISILPDIQNNKTKWEKIDWEEINDKIFSFRKIEKQILELTQPHLPEHYELKSKDFNTYFLVKREKKGYYKARFCLLEWFYIVDFKPYVNISQTKNCILNLGQTPITRVNFEYVEKKEDFFVPAYLKNIYLSNIEEKDSEKLYRFWTFDGWNVQDWYNDHRGIDRFAYIPSKGIVGGSYDFYFGFKSPWGGKYAIDIKLTPEQWKENREQEKIMWAKELFPEKQ